MPGSHFSSCQQLCRRATVIGMLIAFVNKKGGTSKSCLSAHLAIWLFDLGYRTALLDADPQATSACWVRNAEPGITVATATEMDAIQKTRSRLLKSHEIIVADTPGSEGDAANTVTLLADQVVVPLQPSRADLRALKDTLKTIRLAQEVSGGQRPQAILALTFTAKNDVQSRNLRRQLAASGFPVARNEVRRLNAFRDSSDTSVTRLKPSEAKEAAFDIEALFTELFSERLARIPRRRSNTIERRAGNE